MNDDEHGFVCECGEQFESVDALEEHIDDHKPAVVQEIEEEINNYKWTVTYVECNETLVRYIDLSCRSDDDSLKVGASTIAKLQSIGLRPVAWYPEVDDAVDMRIWLREVDE